MANHGYVYTKKELEFNDVVKNINKINYNLFCGHLELETYSSDHSFCIKIPEFGENESILFWISDEYSYGEYREPKEGDDQSYIDDNGYFEEFDEKKLICKNCVLEFRHGGGSSLRWWLEGVFRENLGEIYNGKIGDDGYDEKTIPEPNKYKSFYDYINENWNFTKNEKINGKTIENLLKEFYKNIDIKKRELKLNRILKEIRKNN